jgi:hypothetical protein
MATVAQQLQPSDAGRDQRHDDQRRRDGMQAMTRAWLASIFAVLWLAIGGFGVYGYGATSYQYHGFPPPHDPPGVSSGSPKTITFHSAALSQTRTDYVDLRPGHRAVGVAMDTLVARHAIGPFVSVRPDGRDRSFAGDTEWADTAHGRDESFVLDIVATRLWRAQTAAMLRWASNAMAA